MVNPQQGRADENYKKLKKDYDAELARDAPPYLAHIESYNQDLTDMSDMSKGKQMKKGRCTGSLISTQHVLTYVSYFKEFLKLWKIRNLWPTYPLDLLKPNT